MHRSWIGIGIVIGGACGLVGGFVWGILATRGNPDGDLVAVVMALVVGCIGVIFGAVCGAGGDLARRAHPRPPTDGPEADYRELGDRPDV